MVRRQDFGDFMNSPGPSTPRGRGRGGGRGGGGGGRGGSRGGHVLGGTPKFVSDFTNMPFDYNSINKQKYTKMDGFNVTPFGPGDKAPSAPGAPLGPRGRGGFRGNRGGRGRGLGAPATPGTPRTPASGSATPVTGLGYHGHGHTFDKGKGVERTSQPRFRAGQTVGKEGVTWGGGMAPMFVKAGELFKDGEADVITVDKDAGIHVEKEPMSDPSAPQMLDPRHDVEVELRQPDVVDMARVRGTTPWSSAPMETSIADVNVESGIERVSSSRQLLDAIVGSGPLPSIEAISQEVESDGQPALPERQPEDYPDMLVDTIPGLTDALQSHTIVPSAAEAAVTSPSIETPAIGDVPGESDPPPAFSPVPIASASQNDVGEESAQHAAEGAAVEGGMQAEDIDITHVGPSTSTPDVADANDSLFFVDTEPAVEGAGEVEYTSMTKKPLGQASGLRPQSPSEKILFRPSQNTPKYAQPQPIEVNMEASSSRSRIILEETIKLPEPSEFRPPNRREKKAAKREKRKNNKAKARKRDKGRRREEDMDGSDLDWGSDGPPVNIAEVIGTEEGDQGDVDVDVLRDYLAGTLLGAAADMEEGELSESEEEGETSGSEMIHEAGDGARDVGDGENFELDSEEEQNPNIDSSGSEDGEIIVDEDDKDEEDDDDESDESSDPGQVHFGGEDLNSDDDSDEEDEKDEKDWFDGKDAWDESDWYIEQLDAALDGRDVVMKDRKSRKAIFNAVENGDFGSDWQTEPAKKKNKSPYIPAELQGQWEKDRLRKAEKKRQRDLDRLAAILDPYPATHGKRSRKGKGRSQVEQARLAHLIPESASRVAEMFDIPHAEEFPAGSLGKMGRMANLLPGGRGLFAIDQGIQAFLLDDGKTTYSVPPMDKEGRRKIHMLAECYSLTSKSKGKGKARFTVLTKNARTGVAINHDKAARLVAAAPFSGGQFYKALYARSKDGGKVKKGPADRGSSARMRDGETVGEGAEKIGIDNIGHRLLSKMGWAEGARIGKSEGGLENPIVAIVKNTKMGLGA